MRLKSGKSFPLWRNVLKHCGFRPATFLAIPFRGPCGGRRERPMRRPLQAGPSLYGPGGTRKYLTVAERQRFIGALRKVPAKVRLFCATLMWSGGRLSETLALAPAAIDLDTGAVSLETLKRRRRGIVRQVPLPPSLLRELNRVFRIRAAQR